jgi:hypothetical protein
MGERVGSIANTTIVFQVGESRLCKVLIMDSYCRCQDRGGSDFTDQVVNKIPIRTKVTVVLGLFASSRCTCLGHFYFESTQLQRQIDPESHQE